jgi:YesN/AraC family two-component response regulator
MSITILLVDDNAIFLAAMRHLLARLPGVEVIAQAMDGLEALVTFDQLQPDMVLSDISMPVMTGFELATILRQRPKPPVIVFLSAHDDAHYVSKAKDLGALALVNKADVVDDLLPILQSLIAKT